MPVIHLPPNLTVFVFVCNHACTYVTLILPSPRDPCTFDCFLDATCPTDAPPIPNASGVISGPNVTYTCNDGYTFDDGMTEKTVACGCGTTLELVGCRSEFYNVMSNLGFYAFFFNSRRHSDSLYISILLYEPNYLSSTHGS